MKYVLAHNCEHEDHEEDDEGCHVAYLHEEGSTPDEKIVKVFECKKDALDFMKDNRWSPNHIMIIPYEEGIFDE